MQRGKERMEYSDSYAISVVEQGEYGRRLVRYLENHLSPSFHIYYFTSIQTMFSMKEESALYLLGEEFYKELQEQKADFFMDNRRIILLTWKEEEKGFCRYHNPEELLEQLEAVLGKKEHGSHPGGRASWESTQLTAVYSPVYEDRLIDITEGFMQPEDLYLGVEDIGYREEEVDSEEKGDMGDLCYYIHLREENILNILEEMIVNRKNKRIIYSPDMYFYLRELTREDYKWFFTKLKEAKQYREVFFGAGNGFIANPEILHYFDRVILVDSRENLRQNVFCNRLEQILSINNFCPKRWEKVYREDILNGTAW